MAGQLALIADGLSKRYPRRGQADRVALQPCSFRLAKGECLGVVGLNGAGKSTLLQLLCGTLWPSTGSVERFGRVAALLELGAGFHPEFTGRENIDLSAALMGYTLSEIKQLRDPIIAFAELGSLIDEPVKTYSSGMFVRLAFAVAASGEPEILIIDEALAVGDGAFARKSFERISKLQQAGTSIVFCSHAMAQVQALCNRVLWLDGGKVMALGASRDVLAAYQSFVDSRIAKMQPDRASANSGDSEASASIRGMRLWHRPQAGLQDHKESARRAAEQAKQAPQATEQAKQALWFNLGELRQIEIAPGDGFGVSLAFRQDPLLAPCVVAFTLSDEQGRCLSSVISHQPGEPNAVEVNAQGFGVATVFWPSLPLRAGRYQLGLVLGDEEGLREHESIANAATLVLAGDVAAGEGLVHLDMQAWLSEGETQSTMHGALGSEPKPSARLEFGPSSGQGTLTEAEAAPILVAEGLSKHYGLRGKRVHKALEPCSFTLHAGESLGLIGRNGAGKSTLLQLLFGTLKPSSGSVKRLGRVAALLELGAGFHPEFTGRENIDLSAALMGFSPGQIDGVRAGIIEFADLGSLIDEPVKTYSSGMFVRLAFAVAVCGEPAVLIVDEALAVGDGAFARKSFQRILQLKAAGCSIVFCSHSMYQVEALCDRVLWLDEGRFVALGRAQEVLPAYEAWLHQPNQSPVYPADTGPQRIRLHHGRPATAITLSASLKALGAEGLRLSVCQGEWVIASIPLAQSPVQAHDLHVQLVWPKVELLKGRYALVVHPEGQGACEGETLAELDVTQEGLAQGLFGVAHGWVPVSKQLEELFAQCFESQTDADWYRWKYFSQPAFDGLSLWLYNHDGALLGHYAGFLRSMQQGATVSQALQIGDVMVAAKARAALGRKNAFALLTRSFFERQLQGEMAYAFGFPNARHLRQGAIQGLYRASGSMYEAVWERDRAIQARCSDAPLDESNAPLDESNALVAESTATCFASSDEALAAVDAKAFDALAAKAAAAREAVSALRSLAFWRWRFPVSRGYRWLIDLPAGCAVLKPMGKPAAWELIDWLCLPQGAARLMAQIFRALEQVQCAEPEPAAIELGCWCSQALRDEFEQLPDGLRPTRIERLDFEIAKSCYPKAQHDEAEARGFWMISGDSDFR